MTQNGKNTTDEKELNKYHGFRNDVMDLFTKERTNDEI
jgi:hypothetical protein